ncbi:MAG: di-trans,poly-cis-decaprenylcistransferase [Spirochaetaceae bacterium]|nr:di-trans,poly-cis-decaprenylcistransferase [Spirochaetaceae bacterium]
MTDSPVPNTPFPAHIGIIMDGNGRWAQKRRLKRTDGHLEGLKTARRIVEAANRLGLRYLTLYVFSTENWKRAESEVNFILSLVKRYLVAELDHYRTDRLRVRYAGDMDRLPRDIASEINKACDDTKDYDGMQVVLALNYGGRDEIVRAVNRMLGQSGDGDSKKSLPSVSEDMISAYLDNPDIPDPDFIIRTAGEFRTSNFLLWEGAYSEYYISDLFWPDWTEEDLKNAITDYGKRERRFGAVSK